MEDGICYWGPPGSDQAGYLGWGEAPLLFLNVSSGTTTEAARLGSGSIGGLTASRDRQSVIYTSALPERWNLMLIENFR